MKNAVVFMLLVLFFAASGCKKEVSAVNVRFENQTKWNFTEAYVNGKSLGDLPMGKTSGFVQPVVYNLYDGIPEPDEFAAKVSASERMVYKQPTTSNFQQKIEALPPGEYTIVLTTLTSGQTDYLMFRFK